MTDSNVKIENLVKYLVTEWCKGGSRPTPMVLVKMLYLIDLYFAQETGKTLTNWKWSFHHFGPYCYDSLKAIELTVKSGFIATDMRDSNFNENSEYKTFYLDEDYMDTTSNINLPFKVTNELKRTIKALSFNPNKLLHYVYFSTPPMKSANPSETLSFDGLAWPTPEAKTSELITLPAAKLKQAKEALSKISIASKRVETSNAIYDQEYIQGVAALDLLDDSDEFSANGIASISSLFSKE